MEVTSTAQAALTTSDTENPVKTPPQNTGAKALPKPARAKKAGRKIDTLEKFRAWTPPEDRFKYEWNNGVIEKSLKTNVFGNLVFAQRLMQAYYNSRTHNQSGMLFTEPESMTSATQLRIPDMAYYTAAQIADAAAGKTPAVPEFIIEFVSNHDVHQKVLKKVEEYFKAGTGWFGSCCPNCKWCMCTRRRLTCTSARTSGYAAPNPCCRVIS